MPGGKPGWGSGLTQPLVLLESVRQRIRAALDTGEDEAPPQENGAPPQQQDAPQAAEAPAEPGASLPRRVPGANNAPGPPAHIARPAMLPSFVHSRPGEPVPAVPAATLGAIAAAAGTPSDVAARPEVPAARPEVAARPGPAIAAPPPPPVPAQRTPVEQRPDRHDRRDDAGNGAPPRTPMTRVAMWAYLGQAEAPTEPFPAVSAARPGGVTEKAREQPDAAAQPGPATVSAAEPQAIPAQRRPADAQRAPADAQRPPADAQRPPAEQLPGRTDSRDEKMASPEQATASQDEVPSRQRNGQASLGKPQLHGTKGLARRPGESPPWAPVPPQPTAASRFAPPKSVSPKSASAQPMAPKPLSPPPVPPKPAQQQPQPVPLKQAPPQSASPQSASPQVTPPKPAPPKTPASPPEPARPPERARRGRGVKVALALALVLALAGSLAFLLKRQAGTAQAIDPTAGPSASAELGTAAEVRAAAAAWVAGQVSRANPISCDPVMGQALRAHGVPAADLLVLKPGGGAPLHSRVIVVTAAVTKVMGTGFLTADAPAAIASFGSGSRQISVRMIYPQGAAAYAAALRQDIAERKTSEITLLENPRITAPPAARRQLQGGQVDSRLLLTLAQLASQRRLSIVAFGDRAPGASSGVPLRSADLAVTGDAVGQAQQMSAFAHQLQSYFASARIRAVRLANGQDVVQVEFTAPSPLGVFNR